MKNTIQKTNVAKKSTSAKKVETKTKIANLNLSQFADKLNKIEVKEKKDKETIYRYPENFSKNDLSNEKGKQFRNKIRNRRNTLINNVLFSAKQMQINNNAETEKALKDKIEEWNTFYKDNYLINDYSLKSVSQSNNDMKNDDINLCFQIIKSLL